MREELAKARADLDALAGELSQDEMEVVRRRLPTKRLPPLSEWPELELPRIAVKQDDIDQTYLFNSDVIDDDDRPDPKKRVVFKKRGIVPEKKKRKRQTRGDGRSLLPPPNPADQPHRDDRLFRTH